MLLFQGFDSMNLFGAATAVGATTPGSVSSDPFSTTASTPSSAPFAAQFPTQQQSPFGQPAAPAAGAFGAFPPQQQVTS